MRAALGSVSTSRLLLYADTIRNMRLRQVAYRARRAVPMGLLAAGTRERPPAIWRPLAAGLAVERAPQSGRTPAPERSGTFVFVGASRAFADDAAFWSAGEEGLLFALHLHGFAELARYTAGPRSAVGDAFWEALVRSWLAHEGRPARVGWHPFALSGRIMAWCAALSAGGWSRPLQEAMASSLVRQTQVLRRSIEHDIGGNHVLRNAVALCFAGVCLADARLEARALALLHRELNSQVLADGGHEERSTSYHRAIIGDLDDLDVLLVRAHGAAPRWLDVARDRMRGWERAMVGPDGTLPLLNDAWEGPAESGLGAREAITVLRESGYVVLRHAGDQLIIDAGPVAPRHLAAHAHADVLSFVMWADGQPLIIDRGAFAYTGPQRALFRATRSHNTVVVDERDQCALWGDFRAAFVPRIVHLETEVVQDVVVVAARHDGYRRLADPVDHERWFCWLAGDGLVVVDVLHATSDHAVTSRLHAAPGVPIAHGTRLGPFAVRALGPVAAQPARAGDYAPYLGVLTAIEVLEQAGPVTPETPFGWSLLRDGAHATLDGHTVTVSRRSGAVVHFALDETARPLDRRLGADPGGCIERDAGPPRAILLR